MKTNETKKAAQTENLTQKYPLLMRGRDWRKRIPKKQEKPSMNDKIYMTRDDWMTYYNRQRQKYGNNVIDWPKHQRDYVKRITIVKQEPIRMVQASIPYGNTGVTCRDTGN